MTRWDSRKVGELIDFHNNRRVPLSKRVRADRRGPFPYYGAQGIVDWIDDYRFDGNFLLVAEDGENLRSRKQPVARLVDGQFWVNNHAHVLSPKLGAADGRFLMHVLNQTPLSGRITGAAQPKLTKANLADLEVKCPDYEHQLRISSILAAFDELIEINERRIELLEAFVRSTALNWVRPDRFETPAVLTPQAQPPQAVWRLGRIADLGELYVDGVEPSEFDSEDRYVGLEHLPRRSMTLKDWGSTQSVRSRKLRFQPGDTLFAKIRPNLHKVAWAPFTGLASSDAVVFRPREGTSAPAFVAAILASDAVVAEATATANGTKMPRADPEVLLNFPIRIPGDDVLNEIEAVIRSWLDSCAALAAQNAGLKEVRDHLLPRLVAGQLDISDLDLGILTPTEPE